MIQRKSLTLLVPEAGVGRAERQRLVVVAGGVKRRTGNGIRPPADSGARLRPQGAVNKNQMVPEGRFELTFSSERWPLPWGCSTPPATQTRGPLRALPPTTPAGSQARPSPFAGQPASRICSCR